jgi:hypothetical protein
MNKPENEQSIRERQREIAQLIATAIMRMRAAPSSKNIGKQPPIPLDY